MSDWDRPRLETNWLLQVKSTGSWVWVEDTELGSSNIRHGADDDDEEVTSGGYIWLLLIAQRRSFIRGKRPPSPVVVPQSSPPPRSVCVHCVPHLNPIAHLYIANRLSESGDYIACCSWLGNNISEACIALGVLLNDSIVPLHKK